MFIVTLISVVTCRLCTLCTPTLPVELHPNFQRENDISLVVSSSFSWGKKVKCPEGSLLLPSTPPPLPPSVFKVEIEKGNSFSSVFFSGLLPHLLNLMLNTLFPTKSSYHFIVLKDHCHTIFKLFLFFISFLAVLYLDFSFSFLYNFLKAHRVTVDFFCYFLRANNTSYICKKVVSVFDTPRKRFGVVSEKN